MRSSFAVAVVLAALTACGTDTATKEPEPSTLDAPAEETSVPHRDEPAELVMPENEADRAIRQELTQAIAADPHLKDRSISFLVTNGDISVSGTVRSEQERRRINDLAMNVDGVKSVANALRIEE